MRWKPLMRSALKSLSQMRLDCYAYAIWSCEIVVIDMLQSRT